jgi:phage-related protein
MDKLDPQKLVDKLNELGESILKLSKSATAAIGAIDASIGKFVQLASPAVYNRFALAAKDFQAVFGKILVPVLADVTKTIRGLADALLNASPILKATIQSIADFSVKASILAGKIGSMVALLGGKLVTVLGPVLDLLDKLVTKAFDPMMQVVGQLQGSIGTVVNSLISVAEKLLPLFMELASNGLANTVQQVEMLGKFAVQFYTAIQPVYKAFLSVMEVLQAVQSVITDLVGAALSLVGVALKPIGFLLKIILAPFQILGKLIGFILKPLNLLLQALTKVFDIFGEAFSVFDPIANLFDSLFGAVSDVMKGILETMGGFWDAIGGLFKGLFQAASKLVPIMPIIEKVFSALIDFVKAIGDVIDWVSKKVQWLQNKLSIGGNQSSGAGSSFFPGGPKSSVGAASNQASYTSFYELGQKARQMAAGASESPETRELKNLNANIKQVLQSFLGLSKDEQISTRMAQIPVGDY